MHVQNRHQSLLPLSRVSSPCFSPGCAWEGPSVVQGDARLRAPGRKKYRRGFAMNKWWCSCVKFPGLDKALPSLPLWSGLHQKRDISTAGEDAFSADGRASPADIAPVWTALSHCNLRAQAVRVCAFFTPLSDVRYLVDLPRVSLHFLCCIARSEGPLQN